MGRLVWAGCIIAGTVAIAVGLTCSTGASMRIFNRCSRYRRIDAALAAAAMVMLSACGGPSDSAVRQPDSASARAITDEARAFMDGYARDLLAGDRAAIGARYARTGAYLLGNGRKELLPYDSVAAQYRDARWTPPKAFEWRDLSFEPVGPDAVVVAGLLAWTNASGGAPLTLSYTALLRRQDGVLRIRLEDESIDPRSLPSAGVPADSSRR